MAQRLLLWYFCSVRVANERSISEKKPVHKIAKEKKR